MNIKYIFYLVIIPYILGSCENTSHSESTETLIEENIINVMDSWNFITTVDVHEGQNVLWIEIGFKQNSNETGFYQDEASNELIATFLLYKANLLNYTDSIKLLFKYENWSDTHVFYFDAIQKKKIDSLYSTSKYLVQNIDFCLSNLDYKDNIFLRKLSNDLFENTDNLNKVNSFWPLLFEYSLYKDNCQSSSLKLVSEFIILISYLGYDSDVDPKIKDLNQVFAEFRVINNSNNSLSDLTITEIEVELNNLCK